MSGKLFRLSAFTATPEGGNPAGVWIGESLPHPAEMQRIAKEVGFSETAFLAPATGLERTVRYYSPEAEVSFCGHATIASGVILGETDGDGTHRFSTPVGEIPVAVRAGTASLTSVEPKHTAASGALVDDVLAALRWSRTDLDPQIPPAPTPTRAHGTWCWLSGAASDSMISTTTSSR